MTNELQDKIVEEARSWLGTRHKHQGCTKGYEVDCDNFAALSAAACGVELKEEWVNNYRRVENGQKMLALLEANLVFISDSVDDAQPADVIAFCDGELRQRSVPRHMGILTGWRRVGVPYLIHASERGVVEHRLDALWKRRVHSVWRVREVCGESATPEGSTLKLAQLKQSLEANLVGDPTGGLIVAAVIAVAFSAGSAFVASIFAPKPPTRREGERTGEFPVTTSSFGTFIPEIYGHDFDGSGGGVRVAAIINYIKLHKIITVSRQETGGGKGFGGGRAQTVEQVDYQADVGLMWARGALDLRVLWANTDKILDRRTGRTTGLLDPDIDPDDDYDHFNPPDPKDDYDRPVERHNVDIVDDGDGGGTGTPVLGGYPGLATYPGNATQLPDPTIQAAIDAEFGADSTPAYRHRAYTTLTGFSLAKWGAILPNFTANLQHQTIHTLEDLCEHFCERVGMESGDYDFSAFAGINLRGLLINGSRYAPREIMDILARAYNVYFYENVDGQLVGALQDDVSIVTIDDSELGWIEGEQENDSLPELDTNLANEIDLPRRIDVKFFDPARDFESNLQTSVRQITTGVAEQSLDLQIAMTPDEAREVSDRELYQENIEGTKHHFHLTWEYLYLPPGKIVTINRDEGFTHSIRISSITGDIGILTCEGYAVDTAVFTQPSVGYGGDVFELPPAAIPAMSICVLGDTPLLRDKDATVNNGMGFIFAATPRTGEDQSWQGASLYVDKVGWERIADTTLPATMGRVASFADLDTSDLDEFDATGEFVVDLYGTTATLESATEADVLLGANAALIGDSVVQWTTATRVVGFPNRWKLEGLLHGRRSTENYADDHAVNERFVLLNEAVQLVPIAFSDLNTERSYKCVTVGQSLDDAATITFAWTGRSLMYPQVENLDGIIDAGSNWQFAWDRAVDGELEDYRLQVMNGATVERTIPVTSLFNRALLHVTSSPSPLNMGGGTKYSGSGFTSNDVVGNTASSDPEVGATIGYFINDIEDDPCGITATYATLAGAGGYNQRVSSLSFTDDDGIGYLLEINPLAGDIQAGLSVKINNSYEFNDPDGEVSGTRYTIRVAATQVEFYRNYTGEGSKPFYVSPRQPVFPIKPSARAGPKQSWTAIEYEAKRITVDYPASLQTLDFGSTQSSLKVRVYRVRTVQGIEINGAVREVTF